MTGIGFFDTIIEFFTNIFADTALSVIFCLVIAVILLVIFLIVMGCKAGKLEEALLVKKNELLQTQKPFDTAPVPAAENTTEAVCPPDCSVCGKEALSGDMVEFCDALRDMGKCALSARIMDNMSCEASSPEEKKRFDFCAVKYLIMNGKYYDASQKASAMLQADYALAPDEKKKLMAMIRSLVRE